VSCLLDWTDLDRADGEVRGMQTQDVSKKGLKYGDEDEDEAEKKELSAQKIAFGPLIDWLKKDLTGQISDGG
jgi:heat shock protein beta